MKFTIAPTTIGWWYWFLTLLAMIAGLAGWPTGFTLVVLISGVQFVHYFVTDGFAALSTQVRLVYGAFTVIALADPTRVLWWVMLAGTVMVTFFDRCMIAVALQKMPWNRPHKPA
jgi:hypothetical protein